MSPSTGDEDRVEEKFAAKEATDDDDNIDKTDTENITSLEVEWLQQTLSIPFYKGKNECVVCFYILMTSDHLPITHWTLFMSRAVKGLHRREKLSPTLWSLSQRNFGLIDSKGIMVRR